MMIPFLVALLVFLVESGKAFDSLTSFPDHGINAISCNFRHRNHGGDVVFMFFLHISPPQSDES